MKNPSSRARLAALPVALAAALPSWAQTQDVPQLRETVVTASRSAQLLGSALPHASVITRDEIERSQAPDLVSLLQRQAGLQRTQSGGIGTVSTLFLRGAPSLQTLVLIDGVPQNKQDASGAVSLEHVMLDTVERVEIVRGNVSAIYGSGAIGGVIQIFTRSGTGAPTARVTTEFGPHAFRKLSGSVSASVGPTSISVTAARLSTDGFSSVNPEQQAAANPDADGYRNTSTNLALTHKLSRDHRLGASLMQSSGDNGFDNAYGAATDIQTASTRLRQGTLFTDNTWGGWRSRVSLSEQSDRSESRDNGLFGSTDGYMTAITLLNWTNTLALGKDWLGTAGLEHQRQRVDTRSTSAFFSPYAYKREASAVFAGVEGPVGRGALQFNFRHDKVGDLQQSTGYLGYAFPLTEQFKLIASVSSAFNAPPLGYLFAPGYGNPALEPELARSKEVGLQYARGTHLLRATYFDTRVEQQLNFDTTIFRFANLGRTRNNGLELTYQGSVGASDWRASLTRQDPVDDLTGASLVRRARTLLALGVSHATGAWRLGADLRYSGARPDAYSDPLTFATVKTNLESYSVLDLTLSYKLSPTVLLNARLDNAGNRHYQTVYAYNQQARSLYLGLTWTPRL